MNIATMYYTTLSLDVHQIVKL